MRAHTSLRSLILFAGVVSGAACATTSTNLYRASLAAEEDCCAHLTDANAQAACRSEIPRPKGNETAQLNQETFACVRGHFRCDPATGRPTRESAQQQLDCLNDLSSTQSARE